MPELPEVETIVRGLAPRLEGRVVRSILARDPKLRVAGLDTLPGALVAKVSRKGKQIVLSLTRRTWGTPRWLSIHLGMTGRLIWLESEGKAAAEGMDARAILRVQGGSLQFFDVRRFGRLKLVGRREELETGGVEPLGPDFTNEVLASLVRSSRQDVKVWLLRQDRIVGLGNIYACEALHRAGISPFRAVASLESDELESLREAIIEVLIEAVEHRGTTFSDFVDSSGRTGGFQDHLRVYGREGAPCATCGELVERTPQQGRSTYHCPRCQVR